MYKLKIDLFGIPKGTMLYQQSRYDYGMAAKLTSETGKEHVMVSLRVDGKYHFPMLAEHLEPLTLSNLFSMSEQELASLRSALGVDVHPGKVRGEAMKLYGPAMTKDIEQKKVE